MSGRRLILSALLMCVAVLVPKRTAAQPEPPGTLEREAVQALMGFFDAVAAGDEQALTNLVWSPENNYSISQKQARDLFVKLIIAERRLEQAAIQRFGPADGALLATRPQFVLSPADRKALERATVFIEDITVGQRITNARIVMDASPVMMRLRRADGQWRVIFDLIEFRIDDEIYANPIPPGGSTTRPAPLRQPSARARIQLDRLAAILAAVEQTTERVRAGDIGSARAAVTELTAKVNAAHDDATRRFNELRQRFR